MLAECLEPGVQSEGAIEREHRNEEIPHVVIHATKDTRCKEKDSGQDEPETSEEQREECSDLIGG